jgi:hypothetical protein
VLHSQRSVVVRTVMPDGKSSAGKVGARASRSRSRGSSARGNSMESCRKARASNAAAAVVVFCGRFPKRGMTTRAAGEEGQWG